MPLASTLRFSNPPAAMMRSPLAGSSDGRGVGPFPLDAELFYAEIIFGLDAEVQLLRIEHDFRSRQVFAGQRWGFVVAGRDRKGQRLLALQAELVAPAEFDLARARRPAFDGLSITAPAGVCGRPSTLASESLRLAVAVNRTRLPLTTAIAPPRTSLVTGRDRPR